MKPFLPSVFSFKCLFVDQLFLKKEK